MFFLFITFSSQFEKQGFLGGSVVKNLPPNAGATGLIPDSEDHTSDGATNLIHGNC